MARLQRVLFEVEREFVRTAPTLIYRVGDPDLKYLLCQHIWESAGHARFLRERGRELSGSATARAVRENLGQLFNEAVMPPDAAVALAGFYRVLKASAAFRLSPLSPGNPSSRGLAITPTGGGIHRRRGTPCPGDCAASDRVDRSPLGAATSTLSPTWLDFSVNVPAFLFPWTLSGSQPSVSTLIRRPAIVEDIHLLERVQRRSHGNAHCSFLARESRPPMRA